MTEAAHRFAKDHLKAFVERIERLEEEKKALSDDIRDVFAEAKGNGFDVKALRAVIKLRAMDGMERQEQEAILHTYLIALGMATDDDAPARPTGPQTSAALAKAMADDGLISQEAATETARIAAAVDRLSDTAVARAAANPKVRAALKKLGTPVALSAEEKAKGYSAAFIGKDGTRMAIGAGATKACAGPVADVTTSSMEAARESSAAPIEKTGDDTPSPVAISPSSPDLGQAGDADRPRPGEPSHSNRQGVDTPDATGGADDLDRIPDILRRDADNVAPWMKSAPDLAQAMEASRDGPW